MKKKQKTEKTLLLFGKYCIFSNICYNKWERKCKKEKIMEPQEILIIFCLVIVGLVAIGIVGYVLFRPVAAKQALVIPPQEESQAENSGEETKEENIEESTEADSDENAE